MRLAAALLSFMYFFSETVVASGASLRAVRECWTGVDVARAMADESVGTADMMTDITLRDSDFLGLPSPIPMKRDFSIVGATPRPPIWDMAFVRDKIQLSNGTTFKIERVLMANYRAGSAVQAPGFDLFTDVDGELAVVLLQDSYLLFRYCFPVSIAAKAVHNKGRPPAIPGAQILTLSGPHNPHCSNDTATPKVDRCFAHVFRYIDVAENGAVVGPTGTTTLVRYLLHMVRVDLVCERILSDACIDERGPLGCALYSNGLPQSTPARIEAESRSHVLPIVLGTVLGGVFLVVLAVVLYVRAAKPWWQKRAHLAAKPNKPACPLDGALRLDLGDVEEPGRGGGSHGKGRAVGVGVGGVDSAGLSGPATLGDKQVELIRAEQLTSPPPYGKTSGGASEPCYRSTGSGLEGCEVSHTGMALQQASEALPVTQATPCRPDLVMGVRLMRLPPPEDRTASVAAAGFWVAACVGADAGAAAEAELTAAAAGAGSGAGDDAVDASGVLATIGTVVTADGTAAAAVAAAAAAAADGGGAGDVRRTGMKSAPLGSGISGAGGGPALSASDRLVSASLAASNEPGAEDRVLLLPVVLGKGMYGKVVQACYKGQRVAVKLLANALEQVTAKEAAAAQEGGAQWSDTPLDPLTSPQLDCVGGGCGPQGVPHWQGRAFAQEVEVLGRCNHPNIVRLLAANLVPPALVMELADSSLEGLLNLGARWGLRRPLPLPVVLHIALQVARGLEYLHPTIVHRDLKPANVLINNPTSPRPTAKLTDFGISRLCSTIAVTQNTSGGTPSYMAPEMFKMAEDEWCTITDRADMYAFGVMLWEMLAAQRPWEGYSVPAVAYNVVVRGARPPLAAMLLRHDIHKLARLVEQCFEAEAPRRPAASDAVKQLLLIILEEQRAAEGFPRTT